MKKLIFTFLLITSLSNFASAQTQKTESSKWPYGCRTWTVGINVGFFSMTSEIVLCCQPANWKTPPISCVEINSKSTETGNVYQYIMVKEIEEKINKEIKEEIITVWSDKLVEVDGEKFLLVKKEYPVEINENNDRFVKVLFEKIK